MIHRPLWGDRPTIALELLVGLALQKEVAKPVLCCVVPFSCYIM